MANKLHKIKLDETLLQSTLAKFLLDTREAIIKDQDVRLPQFNGDSFNQSLLGKITNFFVKYARYVRSDSRITLVANEDEFRFLFKEVEFYSFEQTKPLAIMYSDGSESKFMDLTYCSADLIQCETNSFFSHGKLKNRLDKREFQLAVLGFITSYGVTMIGCQTFDYDPQRPDLFEYTDEFVNLWNSSFRTKIQYPLSLIGKDFIYRTLIENDIDFEPCEKKRAPCGECWKCAEKHWVLEALGQHPQFIDHSALVEKVLENTRIWMNNLPDPAGTVGMLKLLEKRYGYTDWRY